MFPIVAAIQLFTVVWFTLRFLVRNQSGWSVFDSVQSVSKRYVTQNALPFIALPMETCMWYYAPTAVVYMFPRHVLRLVPSWKLRSRNGGS